MKIYEKALIGFYSLIIGCIALSIIYVAFNPLVLHYVMAIFMLPENRLIIGAISGIFLIFCGKSLIDIFHKNPHHYALIDATELGTVNITIPTLEHIVVKAAKQVRGVREVKPKVKVRSDGITVFLKANVTLDSNIPLVTQELQSSVKSHIEQIAGIRILEVKVLVDYSSHDLKARVD